ncbi:4949_t:CDS:2, partial [Dentiscutata erythropus]
ALIEINYKGIIEQLVQGECLNTFLTGCVELMLQEFKSFGIQSKEQCVSFLGEKLRIIFSISPSYSHKQLVAIFIDLEIGYVPPSNGGQHSDDKTNGGYTLNRNNASNGNKLYRLQTGQTPIVRPLLHNTLGLDGFPNGTNTIIAVISYTGLGADAPPSLREKLNNDGLPFIGTRLKIGDPLCAYIDGTQGGDDSGVYEVQKVQIMLRIPRPPVIGNKFSSKHGQKGIFSRLWLQFDVSFTESCTQPDVIFNPHTFPSHSTPFRFNEEFTAIDYFGEQL